jgi:hypothetical protein
VHLIVWAEKPDFDKKGLLSLKNLIHYIIQGFSRVDGYRSLSRITPGTCTLIKTLNLDNPLNITQVLDYGSEDYEPEQR